LLWMSLFEQTPCFTTDKHISTMNPRWQHILRRPNLQDLRRLKFTKTKCFRQMQRNLMNLHIYTNRHEGQMFQQYLASDVNLWGIFFMFGSLISIATIARTFPSESVDSSSSSSEEDSSGAASFPCFSSPIS
jgi:hypothetical protein